jgi:hypothetical protein
MSGCDPFLQPGDPSGHANLVYAAVRLMQIAE